MFWSAKVSCPCSIGFHGVMVSTLDFESSDPSSNLGGTLPHEDNFFVPHATIKIHVKWSF